jgi:hypothetical protein
MHTRKLEAQPEAAFNGNSTNQSLASTKEVMNDTIATESQGHPAIRHEPQSSPQ